MVKISLCSGNATVLPREGSNGSSRSSFGIVEEMNGVRCELSLSASPDVGGHPTSNGSTSGGWRVNDGGYYRVTDTDWSVTKLERS